MPEDKKPHPPRVSRDRLDAVFRLAPIGIVVTAPDGKVLSINPAMCQMLGYAEAELLGRNVMDFTAPEDIPRTADILRKLGAQDSVGAGSFEKSYVHKQGHTVWGIANVHLHRDAAGAPDFFVTHVQDVTPHKRAEAVLRESEEKFRIAFENAPVGMTIIGLRGQLLAVNPAMCRMTGYTREALIAGTFNDITHPEDIEAGMRWTRKMMAGDYSEPEFEKRYIHRDRHVVWGLVRAQWVRNDDGSPHMSVVHVLDITERKRAEQALLARERQLREAHVIAQMGHWQLDLANGSMSWADGIFRLLELDPASTTASWQLFTARIHPEDQAVVAEAHRDAIEHRRPSDMVHRLLFADGRTKYVRRICRTEADAAGLRVIGVLQDVTIIRRAEEQRAQLEEQLHRALRMEAIGYLAGGVAHDFNNLLTVIGGNASLAMLETEPNGKVAALLAEIQQSVDSAAELTRQLLAFSRKQVIEPKVMNLNLRIGNLASMLRRLLGENLELVTELAPALGHVRFDLGQAEQILINLAVNARDAMPNGGKLTIRTANVDLASAAEPGDGDLSGPFVMLEVADNGTGMSEETKLHIFEPFFTTKEQGRGTGLGLAMVYGAVKQNQGHMEVASELGKGTSFKIYLPRVEAPVEEPRASLGETSTGGHETILFVEDDAAVRRLGERLLLRQGYRVQAFGNSAEALAAARGMSEPVALLVTDVIMPGMNGRALADELRQRWPTLKVLFVSGYTQNLIAHHGVLEAGVDFLAKPYSSEDLAQRVREVLGSPGPDDA